MDLFPPKFVWFGLPSLIKQLACHLTDGTLAVGQYQIEWQNKGLISINGVPNTLCGTLHSLEKLVDKG
jgi:hypothetical protein